MRVWTSLLNTEKGKLIVRKTACAGLLLGSSVVAVPLTTYHTKKMAKQSRNFGYESELKKFNISVWKLLDQLEVDNVPNAIRKICSMQSIIEKKESELQEYLALTGTTQHGNAKQRIQSLLKKATDRRTVSERYNLDTTFLQGIGSHWDKKGTGDNEVEVVRSVTKSLDRQRVLVSKAYHTFLDSVLTNCQDEGLDDTFTSAEVERWHSAMKDDFNLLTVSEFWQKYLGDLYDITVMPKEPQTVLLHDALPLIKLYAPIKVYQELYDDDPDRLGYIPSYKFDKWNDRAAGLKQLSGAAQTTEKYTLTSEILSEAVYRRIEGPEAILNPGVDETTLRFILTHDDINPYRREFAVSDDTTFLKVHELYLQYSSETK